MRICFHDELDSVLIRLIRFVMSSILISIRVSRWGESPRVSWTEYITAVGPVKDDMVEAVAVILNTGWLTPCRLGDALRFMSVATTAVHIQQVAFISMKIDMV